MKGIAFIIAFITAIILDFNDIAKINSLKDEAENAYLKGEYQMAFDRYQILVDSFKINDDKLLLNYANAGYFLSGMKGRVDQSTGNGNNSAYADVAMSNYQHLTGSKDKTIRSAAYNQLGVINYQLGNNLQQGDKYLSESLSYFKQSLKSNSYNDNARYNYEVVKKQLEDQQDQQQQDEQKQDQEDQKDDQENRENQQDQQQDQDQEQDQNNQSEQQEQEDQPQNDQQKSDKDQQQGEEQQQEEEQQQSNEQQEQEEQQETQQSAAEKLKEMKISEEMAKMILEALRNNEVQYLQQQKRRPTQKADGTKPDW